MSHDAWSGITLTGVASNGDVTQLYPAFCTAGVAKSSSSVGQLIRKPMQGALHSIQLKPDGSHGGTLELYDVNGEDAGADVSSATTITDSQLDTLIAAGKAKLIYSQDFAGTVGSGVLNAPGLYRPFMKGLAGRFVGSGTCELNLVVSGGFQKQESRGSY